MRKSGCSPRDNAERNQLTPHSELSHALHPGDAVQERKEKTMQEFKRGGIFYVEKFSGGNTSVSIRSGGRPALIVSGDRFNRTSDILEVVYLTCNPRNDLPTHVTIRGASKESVAICEQISSVRKERFISYISTASEDEMSRIDMALLLSMGINMNKIKAALAAAGPNWEVHTEQKRPSAKKWPSSLRWNSSRLIRKRTSIRNSTPR